MKFCWSTLKVKNLEESIRFYQEIIGLPVVKRFLAGPHMEIAFLGDGETGIELIQDATDRDTSVGEDISWGFCVESLEKAMALMREKGVEIQSGPFQPNPRTRYFFVLDPNGMKIQLIENS